MKKHQVPIKKYKKKMETKKMEEISYRGQQGVFLTHKEKNEVLHLVKRQSELIKKHSLLIKELKT